ncbi:hypothetical protein CAP35_10575 [Chitinophagaceae bacterium IBVUCB1]|nr:hypothetical protein CAP35_10575 [Chitinophagaceae bacterium IBVUCB1]
MYKKPVLALVLVALLGSYGCRRQKPQPPLYNFDAHGYYSCDVVMHDIRVVDINTGLVLDDSLLYKDTILIAKGEGSSLILYGTYLPKAICTQQGDGNYIGHGISGGDTCTWQLNTYSQKDSMTLMFATQRKYKTVIWNRIGKRI